MFHAARLTSTSAVRAVVFRSCSSLSLPIASQTFLASSSGIYTTGATQTPTVFSTSRAALGAAQRRAFTSGRVLQRLESKEQKPAETVKPTPSPATTEDSSSTRSELSASAPSSPNDQIKTQDPTLREDIYTLPNILTFTRLVAAPVVGYLVLHDYNAWAVGLFLYAGVTDALDGWIARKWNSKTVVGTVIDPMADKALMTSLTVCLAMKGAMPLWLAAIILGRDIGLAIAAVYYRWISLPPPKTFTRYWDFGLPSAEVRPTTISKYNTFLQLALVGATTVMPLVEGLGDLGVYLQVLQYTVAATTIWSGLSYVYSKDAVKILKQSDKTK